MFNSISVPILISIPSSVPPSPPSSAHCVHRLLFGNRKQTGKYKYKLDISYHITARVKSTTFRLFNIVLT